MEEIEKEGKEDMPKRKKSSAYGFVAALTFILAFYLYYTTEDLFLALMLFLLGVGIVLSGR